MRLGNSDGPLLGMPLDDPQDVRVRVVVSAEEHCDQWFGFTLEFPLGSSIEDDGFGMVHEGMIPPLATKLMFSIPGHFPPTLIAV